MNVFKTIGDTLSQILKGPKKADGVDKTDILNLIDNNLILLKTVINTYDENPDIIKYIQTTLLPMNGSNKNNTELLTLYTEYYNDLSNSARVIEKTTILKTIRDTAELALRDHEKIRDNFESLFNQGTDVSEIQLNQLKLSHAAIFGFINLSTLMCDWFCFFYGSLVGQSGEQLRIPVYRDKMIKDSNSTVSGFVSDVLARGTNRDILALIASIRNRGDVTLYSDAATLDSYANINDYPGAMKLFGGAASLFLHSILFVRELFTSWTHTKYKRNLALREWMITKTVVLQMDLNGIDPDSPEYQKKLSVLNKYSDEISKLDKKISQYENS